MISHLWRCNPESLRKNASKVRDSGSVPEQHPVWKSPERLEPLGLPFASNFEHLGYLQGVLGVRGGVRVLHVLLDHLELLGGLLQHLDLGLQLLVMRVNWIHILFFFTTR